MPAFASPSSSPRASRLRFLPNFLPRRRDGPQPTRPCRGGSSGPRATCPAFACTNIAGTPAAAVSVSGMPEAVPRSKQFRDLRRRRPEALRAVERAYGAARMVQAGRSRRTRRRPPGAPNTAGGTGLRSARDPSSTTSSSSASAPRAPPPICATTPLTHGVKPRCSARRPMPMSVTPEGGFHAA